MDKSKYTKQYLPIQDWFFPAVEKDASVKESLLAVRKNLSMKLDFMTKLTDNLCGLSQSDFDAVTDLWNRTRILKTTLEVRLGVLNAERPGGWFREAMFESAGPFQTKTLRDPVFTEYETKLYPKMREQIQKCWRGCLELDDRYARPGDSLWRKLLAYNALFNKIAQVKINKVSTLNLNKVPHELPNELDSPLIRQFLLNVAARLSKLRSELNECYSMLWKSSTNLWRVQMDEFQEGGGSSYSNSSREHFRERRQQKYCLTGKDLARNRALEFMRFSEMPTASDLRSKYIALAKQYHPDLLGGSEERFKKLSEAYRILSEKS